MSISSLELPLEPKQEPEESAPVQVTAHQQESWLERVTLEHFAYGLMIVLAVVVRFINLGLRPISPQEVGTALRAWQASQGLGPALDAGIPLLFSLQNLTFFFFGSNDALVRIWPLLASVFLIPVIAAWRHWVGRDVALLAALFVTISPLINAFGRRGDGVVLAVLAMAIAIAGWAWLQQKRDLGWVLLAVGTGLLLISGPATPTAFLALAILLFLTWGDARPVPAPRLLHGMVFLGVVLVGGTAFFTQLGGLGLIALNWSEWFASFSVSGTSLVWGFGRLLLDEPLVVVIGIAAMIWSWRRGTVVRAFSAAALVVLVVGLLQGPYAAGTRAIATLLLTVPVAHLLLWIIRTGEFRWNDPELVLFAAVLLILIALGVFSLISYSNSADTTQLWLLVATVLMAVALTAIFLFFIGARRVLSMAALVVVAVLFLFNLATVWGLAFDAIPPRFPALYADDTRLGVYDLVTTAGDLSERQRGDRWSLPIAVVTGSDADELLQWYLRQVSELQLVESVGLENAPPLVIAPDQRALSLSERYSGQDFAILDAWDPSMGDSRQKIAWAIFRIAPWNIPTRNHVLWADVNVLSLE